MKTTRVKLGRYNLSHKGNTGYVQRATDIYGTANGWEYGLISNGIDKEPIDLWPTKKEAKQQLETMLINMKKALFFDEKLSNTKIKSLGVSLTTYYQGTGILAYKMYVDGKLLFKGNDYKPSPALGIDTIEANVDLLGLLTVGVGDTDSDYFKDYTPIQLEWAMNFGTREELSLYVSDFQAMEDFHYSEAVKQFTHKVL